MSAIDRYESPKTLATVANAPELVCRMVFFIALGHRDSIEAIRSESKLPDLCAKRQAIVYAAREYAGATFSQIGRAIGRDGNGSTVVRCYNRAKRRVLHERDFRQMCHDLRDVVSFREQLRLKARTNVAVSKVR